VEVVTYLLGLATGYFLSSVLTILMQSSTTVAFSDPERQLYGSGWKEASEGEYERRMREVG
jgi:phenylpyruvate tautomerase PptA (4-oxalocrotonate tautomerase family)